MFARMHFNAGIPLSHPIFFLRVSIIVASTFNLTRRDSDKKWVVVMVLVTVSMVEGAYVCALCVCSCDNRVCALNFARS